MSFHVHIIHFVRFIVVRMCIVHYFVAIGLFKGTPAEFSWNFVNEISTKFSLHSGDKRPYEDIRTTASFGQHQFFCTM